MQLFAAKTPRICTKAKKAIFKHYNINEETYRHKFWSAKAKERESPTEIVTHLTDMAASGLKSMTLEQR